MSATGDITPDDAQQLIEGLKARHQLVEVATSKAKSVLLHADMVRELEERVFQALGRLHEESPLMSAHDRQKVQSQLDYVGDEGLVHATVDRLIQKKRVGGDLRRIARADFKPKLSTNQRKLNRTIRHMEQISRRILFGKRSPRDRRNPLRQKVLGLI